MIEKSLVGRLFVRYAIPLAAALILTACRVPPQSVTVMQPAATDERLRQDLPLPTVEPKANIEIKPAVYLIAVDDELDIKILDHGFLNETVRVRPDGNISVQIIGTVPAEGRSTDDLQADIARRFHALYAGVGKKEYLIHANDELEINFTYRHELNQATKVRPDGRITLPMIDTVVAEDKTPEQLTSELRSLYNKFVRNPDLVVIVRSAAIQSFRLNGRNIPVGLSEVEPTVSVRTYATQQIFVGGEVLRPGVLPYRRSLTLIEAIIEAGGNKPSAELRSVLLLRKGNAAQPLAIRRDLSADLNARSTNDVVLEPFDVVVVPRTTAASIADMLEQSVFRILPPLKNSAFSFLYQVGRTQTQLIP